MEELSDLVSVPLFKGGFVKTTIVFSMVGLILLAACAKHESVNRSYRKPGNDFVGEKPSDAAGLMQEAIANDDLPQVLKLLADKFDIDASLPNQRTPLIHATREAKYRIMSELIKRNANLQARDRDGRTALDHALQNAGKDSDGNPVLNRAIVLLSEEAQLSQRKELMKFAGRGSSSAIINLLAGIGIDPNFIDESGDTPLTLAIRNRKALGVDALAQWKDCHGGEESPDCLRLTATDLDLAGSDGVKPLTLARQMENADIIEILTQAGAKE